MIVIYYYVRFRFGRQLHDPPPEDIATSESLHEIHCAKHGLINAETAMTLAVHRLLSSIQRMNPPGQSIDKAAKAIFYLSKASTFVNIVLFYSSLISFLPSSSCEPTLTLAPSHYCLVSRSLDWGETLKGHLTSIMYASMSF